MPHFPRVALPRSLIYVRLDSLSSDSDWDTASNGTVPRHPRHPCKLANGSGIGDASSAIDLSAACRLVASNVIVIVSSLCGCLASNPSGCHVVSTVIGPCDPLFWMLLSPPMPHPSTYRRTVDPPLAMQTSNGDFWLSRDRVNRASSLTSLPVCIQEFVCVVRCDMT